MQAQNLLRIDWQVSSSAAAANGSSSNHGSNQFEPRSGSELKEEFSCNNLAYAIIILQICIYGNCNTYYCN